MSRLTDPYTLVVSRESYKEEIWKYIFCEPWLLNNYFCPLWHIVSLAPVNASVEGRSAARILDGHLGQVGIIWNRSTDLMKIEALATAEVAMGTVASMEEPFPDVNGVPSYRNTNRDLCVHTRKYAYAHGYLWRVMYHINAFVPIRLDSHGNVVEREQRNLICTSRCDTWDGYHALTRIDDFLVLIGHVERSWTREQIEPLLICPLKALDYGLSVNPKRIYGVDDYTKCHSTAPLHLLRVLTKFGHSSEVTYEMLLREFYCPHYTKGDLETIPVFFQFPMNASLVDEAVTKRRYVEGLCQTIVGLLQQQYLFNLL